MLLKNYLKYFLLEQLCYVIYEVLYMFSVGGTLILYSTLWAKRGGGGGLVSIKHSAKHTAMAATCLQMAELILGEESEERDGSEERDEGLGKK